MHPKLIQIQIQTVVAGLFSLFVLLKYAIVKNSSHRSSWEGLPGTSTLKPHKALETSPKCSGRGKYRCIFILFPQSLPGKQVNSGAIHGTCRPCSQNKNQVNVIWIRDALFVFHQWFAPVAQPKSCLTELQSKTIFLPFFSTNNYKNYFIYRAAALYRLFFILLKWSSSGINRRKSSWNIIESFHIVKCCIKNARSTRSVYGYIDACQVNWSSDLDFWSFWNIRNLKN